MAIYHKNPWDVTGSVFHPSKSSQDRAGITSMYSKELEPRVSKDACTLGGNLLAAELPQPSTR